MKATSKMIDFRSDTVTKPSKDMLEAIVNARVGDDEYSEDPEGTNSRSIVQVYLVWKLGYL